MSEIVIRRIVFALDAASDSADSLEAAAELAERLHAELVGVFVEDANLLRLTALPFVREINLASGQWQSFDPEAVERDMRARAARARQNASACVQVTQLIGCSLRRARPPLQVVHFASARVHWPPATHAS